MILSCVLAAAGVLCCVLSILLLKKKKLSRSWAASLLACSVIIGCVGAAGVVRHFQKRAEEYSYIYLALRYLEQQRTDPAALYLKRVTEYKGYHLTAAQTLLEQIRGNGTVAKLRMDILEGLQDGSEDQKNGLIRLQTWTQMENGLESVSTALRAQLPISTGRKQQLEQSFAMETGGYTGDGSLDFSGSEESLMLQINQSLGWQDWYGAMNSAIQLVEKKPSASNRLLLAEVIADVTYSNGTISTHQFASDGASVEKDTQAQESEALLMQYQTLMDELTLLEQEMMLADETEREALAERSAELSEEAQNVLIQAENIFALRALNSIADIRSLEAQVVRAKLYYAMHNYQQAIETLTSASGSVASYLSDNQALIHSLQLVRQVYESDSEIGVDTPEFQEEMQILFGSVHPQLIQLGLTPLSTSFTERIVSDQKTYGTGLYVVGLNAGQHPRIQVQLGGQAEIIEDIINQHSVTIHDTQKVIETYEAEYTSQGEGLNSICFVVDTSGSMGGGPIQNAREALNQFLDEMPGNMEASLVRFDSSAETMVELTTSVVTLKNAVNGISAGGGTDITAGIAEGTSALSHARGARTMIMMTDGQSSVDMSVIQAAVDQGITIFTIGFGDVIDDLLQSIADMSGGQYIRADSSTELANVYSSLQGLIGNTITITYTVESTEDVTRYFFLMDEQRNLSVRREYLIGQDDASETESAVRLDYAPVMQTRENLSRMLQRGEEAFYANYSGVGLERVSAAYVGDYVCEISSQSNRSLSLNVPTQIPDGIFAVTLQTQDGETYSLPDMMIVGMSFNCRNYRAGSLQLTANQALRLEEDLLVLGNSVYFSEIQTEDETLNTLDLRLDGVLMFKEAKLPEMTVDEDGAVQQTVPDQLDLGGTGLGQGRGLLRLNYNDKAFTNNVDTVILNGSLRLEYDIGHSRITTEEEGDS